MAIKRPTVKKAKTTMEGATIYLRSQKKWGKTTLFRNLVLAKYGDAEKGFLIGLGAEEGYDFLDQINATQIDKYEDLKDTVDWLISEKGKEHDIRMIGFDVVDELMPLMEAHTIKLSQKETGKPCKTINQAFDGHHNGQIRCALETKKLMQRLKKAGFTLIAISHTKNKTIKPQGCQSEDDGYMQLTSTLMATYEAVFADIFDFVFTGVVEKEVKDGKLEEANRYLYFRSDGYVDAGGRLGGNAIKTKMLWEGKSDYELAQEFIEVVEDAIRKSALNPLSKEEFKKEQKKEEEKIQEKAKEFIEDEQVDSINIERNEEIKKIITSKWKETSKEVKEEIKTLMADKGISKIGDVENNPTSVMEEILKKLN